jgi:subtilase family serine protease
MAQSCTRTVCALSVMAFALGFVSIASAENHNRLITDAVDNGARITLAGNTRKEAIPANDRGRISDDTPMKGLQFVLQRSLESEAAFTHYIDELHDPKSALFHKWLSNAEIGEKFGPSDVDIAIVKDWLTQEGFHVNLVSSDKSVIEFDGDAGHVASAFEAPLHKLVVDGREHISNVNDPTMPAAFAPVVKGIASLSDFMPHAMHVSRTAKRPGIKNGNAGGGYNIIGAADLATLYNFNPLFAAGITGKGQTIVVIEDTTQYSAGDWTIFRKVMGLSRTYPYGTLTQVSPTGTADTCTNPGDNSDDTEAAIDVDWATAAAPNAAIVSAACSNTSQFGGFLALANLLTEANPPKIVSISYGESEPDDGAAENLYINNLYASAAAEGVSVYVSSGDELAASSDGEKVASHGITVSGFTSTPYNISVGGTDMAAEPLGETSTYYSSTNGPNFLTALSYGPEIPWSDSCTSSVTVDDINAVNGTSFTQFGPTSFCNYANGADANDDGLLGAAGGSGGPSNCATGKPTTSGVANGTCAGYPKPSWQSVFGNPADGVRDIPDVSLMAGNGLWGVYYAACISNPADGPADEGFVTCGANPADWTGWGGTSVASPIWAAIQALVNQKTGESWGNSNTVLYSLARTEYGASGNASCNSTLGNAIGKSCVFNDVTLGDNSGVCDAGRSGTFNCYLDGAKYGILSTSNTADDEAYPATPGWDFTSGIGTANAANVVNSWSVSVASLKAASLSKK